MRKLRNEEMCTMGFGAVLRIIVLRFALIIGTCAATTAQAAPFSSEEIAALYEIITTNFEQAQTVEGRERLKALRKVREVSDRMVQEFPGSDEALGILVEQRIGEVDLSQVASEIAVLSRQQLEITLSELGLTYDQIGRELVEIPPVQIESAPDPVEVGAQVKPATADAASNNTADATSDKVGPSAKTDQTSEPDQSAPLVPARDYSNLSKKEIMRRTQSALNNLGCDVGSADGVAGRKTRSGHERFMKARQLEVSVMPLGSTDLLGLLESLSGTVCEPLPEIQLTASNMSGQWSFRSRCGSNARPKNTVFTGALSVRHRGGGYYSGRARNSKGLNGDVSFRLSGRSVKGVIDWGLLFGKTNFRGSVAKESLTIYGRDTNGCRLSARKR